MNILRAALRPSSLRHLYRLRRSTPVLRPAPRWLSSDAATSDPSQAELPITVEPFAAHLVPEVYPTSISDIADEEYPSNPNEKPRFVNKSRPGVRRLVRPATMTLRNVITRHAHPHATADVDMPTLALVRGMKGVGKSTLLEQAVAHARENDFIVLFIPNTLQWVDGPGFFTPAAVSGRDPLMDGVSAVRFYDRPRQTGELLHAVMKAHGEQLARVPAPSDLAPEGAETVKCDNLREVVEEGLSALTEMEVNWTPNLPTRVGDSLHHLVRALMTSSARSAVVIDDFHNFTGLTCMVDERRRALHANSIRVIAQLFGRDGIEQLAKDTKNGFVLLATQQQPSLQDWRRSRVLGVVDFPLSEDILNDPSGRKWLVEFANRMADESTGKTTLRIDVPDFLPKELKALCSTLSHGGLKREGAPSLQRSLADRLVALAGGRGSVMSRIFAIR